MSESKILHRVIRRLAGWAVWSFFTEVHVIGGENVPTDGPMIVTATHHNMILDPAILSSSFPHRRILHYWSKASLFVNPVVNYILTSSCNIPVDRTSKDRQLLFKGTFDVLSKGDVVALFPEGTSYTEPRIMQIKDGAAWAALEYTKWATENKAHAKDVVVVPAAIVYTNKSKYRSYVILEFGRPITMDPFKEQFLSEVEGGPRAAVKRLSNVIAQELVETTINAPDWDTLYAARMARDLMWEDPKSISLDDFVAVSQTLVDLFSTSNITSNFSSVKRHLLEYYSLLQTIELSNSVLSNLPLPRTLDPNHPSRLPSRLYTLFILIRDTFYSLFHLPFFFLPLLFHLPIYIMARLGARLAEDEEEAQAQNKVVFGLLLCLMLYPTAFFVLWAFLWFTPAGALGAAITVWLFAIYHNQLINENYENAKRVAATWRVLIGVWAPEQWDLSLAALAQYTKPSTPKANPWIVRPLAQASYTGPQPSLTQVEPPVQALPRRRPPSRRIMRHVLRARDDAARALAAFFDQLDKLAENTRVRASTHLARSFGGSVEDDVDKRQAETSDVVNEPQGWRSAKEVVAYLRLKGAKTAPLERGIEGGWAALASDTEGTQVEESDGNAENAEKEDDAVWVHRTQSFTEAK